MRNFHVLTDALAFIEANLCEDFTQQDVARWCHVSLSSLQKLFRLAVRHSLGEYTTKRRLTEAAKEMSAGGTSVLELALKYRYRSPEVFARAFKQLWGVTPSQFGAHWRFTGIFPKIKDYDTGGSGMYKQRYDISELYDEIKKRMGCYILYFDIKNLMEINAVSYAAGDAAIRECLQRIDKAGGDDALLFRIGGDEFVLVTATKGKQAARAIAQAAVADNGRTVAADGKEIPVSMWAGGMVMHEDNLKYDRLFARLQAEIDKMKSREAEIVIL